MPDKSLTKAIVRETLESLAGIKEALSYDPKTGILTWIISPSIGVRAGDVVGTVTSNGYLTFDFLGETYLAHRVGWAISNGRWPEALVDHRDGVHSHNAIENLREATRSQSSANRRGWGLFPQFKGVHRKVRPSGTVRYGASIQVNKKRQHLGYFASPEEASLAYQHAELAAYGEFAFSARDDGLRARS